MKRLIFSLLMVGCVASAGAQLPLAGGTLTGSLESNSIYYLNDSALGEKNITFGSNDYLKLAYYNGRWSAGLQGDAYLPALIGYDDVRNAGGSDYTFALDRKSVV